MFLKFMHPGKIEVLATQMLVKMQEAEDAIMLVNNRTVLQVYLRNHTYHKFFSLTQDSP